jgi:hypothetical protein
MRRFWAAWLRGLCPATPGRSVRPPSPGTARVADPVDKQSKKGHEYKHPSIAVHTTMTTFTSTQPWPRFAQPHRGIIFTSDGPLTSLTPRPAERSSSSPCASSSPSFKSARPFPSHFHRFCKHQRQKPGAAGPSEGRMPRFRLITSKPQHLSCCHQKAGEGSPV